MKRIAILLALIVCLALAACGPSDQEQITWANDTCAAHAGVDTFDNHDEGGSGDGPATVQCNDGFLAYMPGT